MASCVCIVFPISAAALQLQMQLLLNLSRSAWKASAVFYTATLLVLNWLLN